MKYVGLQQQITSNNRKSVVLLLLFPILVLVMVYAFIFFTNYSSEIPDSLNYINQEFISTIPFVLIAVGIWFVIAYFTNTTIINKTAGSHTLSRKENMRVYNLTENLCMSVGMKMPKLRIIESQALNAFASGINENSYTVTLTRGIINALEDDELEGVIAHELTHIRNHDVKLLIVSIIFVGIFAFVMRMALRGFIPTRSSRNRKNNEGGGGGGYILIIILAVVAYFLSFLFKMALSRRREYMADAGAVELTRNPLALARALEKISGNSHIKEVKSDDIQEMYIDYTPPKSKAFNISGSLFASHPPIEKRIAYLKQLYEGM